MAGGRPVARTFRRQLADESQAGDNQTADARRKVKPCRRKKASRRENPVIGRAFDERDEAPTIEVRVWRHGELVHTELCESEEQASLVLEEWQEMDGVRCEVDDMSVRHRQGEILEPEPPEPTAEDYLEQAEEKSGAASRQED